MLRVIQDARGITLGNVAFFLLNHTQQRLFKTSRVTQKSVPRRFITMILRRNDKKRFILQFFCSLLLSFYTGCVKRQEEILVQKKEADEVILLPIVFQQGLPTLLRKASKQLGQKSRLQTGYSQILNSGRNRY